MELVFCKYDGTTTALNPRIEQCGEQIVMKLNEQNCDYFLLFSGVPGERVDLWDENIQNALMEKKELFPEIENEILMEKVRFSCIEWSRYRINDYAIDLSGGIAEYMVAGCRREQDTLRIFVPDESMRCTATVSLTVSYRISRAAEEKPRRFFSREKQRKAVYVVEFDPIPNYQDGGIVYRLDGLQWDYPITSEMLSNGKFYIDAGYGMPVFSTKIPGLELKQL